MAEDPKTVAESAAARLGHDPEAPAVIIARTIRRELERAESFDVNVEPLHEDDTWASDGGTVHWAFTGQTIITIRIKAKRLACGCFDGFSHSRHCPLPRDSDQPVVVKAKP